MSDKTATHIRTKVTPSDAPVKVTRLTKKRAKYSERLMRNTAIACALLLGILALKNIDQPLVKRAVNGVETALTMRVDIDKSLGKLEFVRSIMPESSLVFFNMSGNDPLRPVSGDIVHAYSNNQPWTLYDCENTESVVSAMAGSVSAVTKMTSGDWCVLIDHGNGIETMYAYLDKPLVDAGDTVIRGGEIGSLMGDTLYFETRVGGASVDPDEVSND